jgi:hypothetical protein
MACSGDSESATTEVLSNVIRPKQKGPFTSADGKCRKFTGDADVDLQFLVEKHKEDIAKGRTFVDKEGDAVLACVFHSLPTKVLPGGFAEGRMHERGLVLWIRERSEYCHDLNLSSGGAGRTPNGVATCVVSGMGGGGVGVVRRRPGGSGYQGGTPVQARAAARSKRARARAAAAPAAARRAQYPKSNM